MNLGLNCKVRNARCSFRTSSELKKALSKFWKDKKRPSPNDYRKDISFESERDFLEFVMSCILSMPKTAFIIWARLYNPWFKE